MFAIRPTYLIMVTAENNNKYYNCFPEGDNFRVEYGRVNSTKTITNYPMSKDEIVYYKTEQMTIKYLIEIK